LLNESALKRLDEVLSNLEGRDKWYQLSYPSIIQHFQKTKGDLSIPSNVLRISCVSSWIPAVLKSNIEIETLKRISYFEDLYKNSKLWEIGTESYLGGIYKPGLEKYHGMRIFAVQSDNSPYLLKDYLEPVARLLNSSDRWQTTISTSSKYLHFMLPNLFPIFDKTLCNRLFRKEAIDDVTYSVYIFALQDVLVKKKFILEYAAERNISPLRVIDNILFHIPIHHN
jgi:hypothetical protein